MEKGGFRNEKKVAKEKEEAIKKANTGGMWKVKIMVKLSLHFFIPSTLQRARNIIQHRKCKLWFFSNTKDLIVPSSAKKVNQNNDHNITLWTTHVHDLKTDCHIRLRKWLGWDISIRIINTHTHIHKKNSESVNDYYFPWGTETQMRSPAWHIPCYTLFCRSDEPMSPLALESELMWLHSEQVQDPTSEKKQFNSSFLMLQRVSNHGLVFSGPSFEEQK